MLSVDYNQEMRNALIGFVMFIIAVLFLLYMGSTMVQSTHSFFRGNIL